MARPQARKFARQKDRVVVVSAAVVPPRRRNRMTLLMFVDPSQQRAGHRLGDCPMVCSAASRADLLEIERVERTQSVLPSE